MKIPEKKSLTCKTKFLIQKKKPTKTLGIQIKYNGIMTQYRIWHFLKFKN